MLPVALKAVWFCLSFTGIIATWVVMSLFSRAIGSYWFPMLYSVFATLLQGIFCLGMIWHMDPYRMPRGFCIAQTFIIYYAAWSLTGVCAAFTFATSSTVLWPSTMRFSAASTLAWSNKYYLPIIVFPLTCLSISVPVLFKVDAIQPTEDLHCDASNPEWGRFLGYAGFSMILTLPCFFLSAAAARRVLKLHLHNQRSGFSPRPRSRSHVSQKVATHALTSPITFNPRPLDPETPFSSQSFKTALTPADVDMQPLARSDDHRAESPPLPATANFDHATHPQKISPQWTLTATIDEDIDFNGRRRTMAMSTPVVPNKPSLAPAIWRMILFQMMFFFIQFLAGISTIVDVATHRPTPTPFGSQHIAIVLVGWGPAAFFAHLPAVRRKLIFWKR